MNQIKTSWSKEIPPFGAFDDYVIVEPIDLNMRLLIRPEEFDYLTAKLFESWKKGKSNYIQILREWSECVGFNDIEEKPSIISDINDTIDALKLIEGTKEIEYAKLANTDLKLILKFFQLNKNNRLTIWKD